MVAPSGECLLGERCVWCICRVKAVWSILERFYRVRFSRRGVIQMFDRYLYIRSKHNCHREWNEVSYMTVSWWCQPSVMTQCWQDSRSRPLLPHAPLQHREPSGDGSALPVDSVRTRSPAMCPPSQYLSATACHLTPTGSGSTMFLDLHQPVRYITDSTLDMCAQIMYTRWIVQNDRIGTQNCPRNVWWNCGVSADWNLQSLYTSATG